MTTYFKAMGTGYFKVFGSTTDHFWCCTGTGMENFTRLNDSVYFHDAKDLWVIYYVSSTLNWKDRGLSLTQTTDLPASNKVSITITRRPDRRGQPEVQKALLGRDAVRWRLRSTVRRSLPSNPAASSA